MPMYYNQTHNQLLLIYIKKKNEMDLENNCITNIDNKQWVKTVFKEKKKKKKNLKKTTSTLKSMCGSR